MDTLKEEERSIPTSFSEELYGNEGTVNMGGMCSSRVCYLFWFDLHNFQYWMFKMYGNYTLVGYVCG
ncbi:26S proteasome regulatory subunit 4-like protein B [Iris pallida]|uniref:26S proteasome regulatory subunit 4-like protein B n=1 Tax=Iris pallida TaxID=29817 RepID=A0AAX6FTW2_IRIPA|nr:26S proteasome regulatory subunit 4-like protein B [Iris pallida]